MTGSGFSNPSSRSRSRNGCLSFDRRAPTLHCFVCDLFDVSFDGLNRQFVQHAKYSRGDAVSHLQGLPCARFVRSTGSGCAVADFSGSRPPGSRIPRSRPSAAAYVSSMRLASWMSPLIASRASDIPKQTRERRNSLVMKRNKFKIIR